MNENTVAIVGGGFCGVMLVTHLISQAQNPLAIVLIERTPRLGKGISYGTTDPNHLLNVQAIKMGAFANEPEHFFHWVVSNENLWRKAAPSFDCLKITPQAFLPRMLYGIYLNSILSESIGEASKKRIKFSVINAEAIDLQLNGSLIDIFLSNGEMMTASAAILAIGLPPSKNLNIHSSSKRYIQNIWDSESTSLLQANYFTKMPPATTVLIIGSGLTMIDVSMTLINQGYKGKIIALSKEGKLPEKQRGVIKAYPIFLNDKNLPKKILHLLQIFRQQLLVGKKKGYDWRSVVDSIRPVTVPIWIQLPLKEKKRFLRCLLSLWNRHRHRSAPECLEKIERHQADKKFVLFAGKVLKIEKGEDQKVIVSYVKKGSEKVEAIQADYVFNCSGAETNLAKNDQQLIKNLLKNNLIIPDDLNLGIQVTAKGEVRGKAKGLLFAVGHILFGERFETIAVPELRVQCSELADHILYILKKAS